MCGKVNKVIPAPGDFSRSGIIIHIVYSYETPISPLLYSAILKCKKNHPFYHYREDSDSFRQLSANLRILKQKKRWCLGCSSTPTLPFAFSRTSQQPLKNYPRHLPLYPHLHLHASQNPFPLSLTRSIRDYASETGTISQLQVDI